MARYRCARPKRKKIYLQSKKAAPNTAPSAHAATAAKAPNFLMIPGELRNKIYRLALISADRILIAKGQFEEPSLRLACRQIRTEASKIYYLENKWTIDYPSWEYSVAEGFVNHVQIVRGFDLNKMAIQWRNSGSYKNKANLLALAKGLHEGKEGLRWLGAGENRRPLTPATMGALEIAKTMRKSPWEEVQRVLEIYLQQVAKQTKSWTWV